MKLFKFYLVFFALMVLTGCYGNPAFDGDLEVDKSGTEDSRSEEPCVGEFGKAILSWSSSDPKKNADPENKYIIYYGVQSGVHPQAIELPATGGIEYDTTYENEEGETVSITKQSYSHTIDNLVRGFTYYFVIKAANDAGESLPSNEVYKEFVICPTENDDMILNF